MKKFKWLAIVMAFGLLASACGDSGSNNNAAGTTTTAGAADGTTTTAASGDSTTTAAPVDQTQGGDLTFYMITHSDDGPFWSVVKRGAEAAASNLGVKLVWQGSNNNPEKQVQDIDAAVSAGASGIAASLPSPDALIPPLKAAVDAGIPVITLNSGVNDYESIGALTHVGQTELIAGEGAGKRYNDAGATVLLCGTQEQSNVGLTERCKGATNTFNGKVIESFMGLDADQASQQATINATLAADPSIDAFLGTGPVIAMSGLRAAQDLGRAITIGGFDITPEIITAIKAGDVAFTVDQQQYLQGYMPVLLLYLNVTNQNTLGGGLPILTGPGFVTPDNAAAVEALVAAGTR